MRKEILIQVLENDGARRASFTVEFKTEEDVDETMKRIFPLLLARGVVSHTWLDYDLEVGGVRLQKNKRV